jgi:hypothetical protein
MSLNQRLPERANYKFNTSLPVLIPCIFQKSDLKCDSLKQKTHNMVRSDLNRRSKSTTGTRNLGLLQHIQKSTGFLSNVLFGLNHGYFVQAQVIFTL